MGKEAHDVAIIGGGIAGVSLAYFLATAGVDACVIERNDIGAESTGRSAGIIGQGHRPAPDLPLVMRAVQLWKRLADESELDFEFRQHGTVSLAWSEQHAADLQAMAARERAHGLECAWLDRVATHDIVPAVRGAYLGSIYYPSDASAQPYRACLALARTAVRAGAVIHEHRAVTAIEVTQGRVTGVLTTAGPIATENVVVAAGSWSASLAHATGVRIDAEARRSHLIVTAQVPPLVGPVVATHLYGYFRQTRAGNILIGYPARPVDGFDRRVTFEAVRLAATRAARLIPAIAGVSIIRAFTGFTTWTPDGRSVIGAAREPRGLYVATAFCGRGVALGPAVGEALAELILSGRTSVSFDAHSLDRFEVASTRREREKMQSQSLRADEAYVKQVS
jgi:sarcosine oxidase subunit beta